MTLRLAAIATSTVVCGTLAARGRHDLAPEHPLTEAERSSGSRSAPYSRAPCTASRWLIMCPHGFCGLARDKADLAHHAARDDGSAFVPVQHEAVNVGGGDRVVDCFVGQYLRELAFSRHSPGAVPAS
jgi:hypothetical protein